MKKDIDVSPLMQELFSYQRPWSDRRAKLIPLHKDTLSISLRAAIVAPGENINNVQIDERTPDYVHFPHLTSLLERFAKKNNAALARINIVSLKPNSQVYAHIDGGAYYERRDRYHLVLQSPSGSRMVSGGEECIFKKGELWWFDNKAMHEAFNPSDGAERIHVIFDMLPHTPWWKKILRIQDASAS